MEFVCTKCGHKEAVTTRKSKCGCGGLWKLDYVPPKYSAELIDHSVWGLFRYRSFIKAMKAGAADITAEPVQRTMAEGIAIGLPMCGAGLKSDHA